jgi:hypothetical protein
MNRRSFLQMLGIGVVPVTPVVLTAAPNAFSGMIVMTASSWCTMSHLAGSPQSYVSSHTGLHSLSTQQIVFSNRT